MQNSLKTKSEKLKLNSINVSDVAYSLGLQKQSNGHYKCFNPDHKDDTPSLSINEKGFHCFGCEISGNAIDLVMLYKRYNQEDAEKYLAEKYPNAVKERKTAYSKKNLDSYNIALKLKENGISFIPQNKDVSKTPAINLLPKNEQTGKPEWIGYREKLPTDAECELWFKKNNKNIAIVTGKIHDRDNEFLILLDFDNAEIYRTFYQENKEICDRTVIDKSGKGYHVWFRLNKNLKKTAGYYKGLFFGEIIGEGNLCTVPNSYHVKSRKHYEWIREFNTLDDVLKIDSLDEIGVTTSDSQKEEKKALTFKERLRADVMNKLSKIYRYNQKTRKYFDLKLGEDKNEILFIKELQRLIYDSEIYENELDIAFSVDKNEKKSINAIVKKVELDIATEFCHRSEAGGFARVIEPFGLKWGISKLKENKYYFEVGNKVIKIDRDDKPHEYFDKPTCDKEKLSDFFEIMKNTQWQKFAELFSSDISIRETALASFVLWCCNVLYSYDGKTRRNPIMPILSGKQGLGKDNIIFPALVSWIPERYINGNLDASYLTDERKFPLLSDKIVGRFSEMVKFDKSDLSALKRNITARTNNARELNTHREIEVDNFCNHIGTTNAESFDDLIKDYTGERRFVFLPLREDLTTENVQKIIESINWQEFWGIIDVEKIDTDAIARFIRGYQESIKYKTFEDEFIEEFINFVNTGKSDYRCFKNIDFDLDHFSTRDLYAVYDSYSRENNRSNFIPFISVFGRKLKKLREYYDYDKYNRKYTVIKKVQKGFNQKNEMHTLNFSEPEKTVEILKQELEIKKEKLANLESKPVPEMVTICNLKKEIEYLELQIEKNKRRNNIVAVENIFMKN